MADDLDAAHDHCNSNRQEIEASKVCGCFYCLRTFGPAEIWEWVGKEDRAVCPYCGIDSVLGDASGLALDRAFLQRMHDRWFNQPPTGL